MEHDEIGALWRAKRAQLLPVLMDRGVAHAALPPPPPDFGDVPAPDALGLGVVTFRLVCRFEPGLRLWRVVCGDRVLQEGGEQLCRRRKGLTPDSPENRLQT